MEIVLISALCGILMTLNTAYGNTITGLESKIFSKDVWYSEYKGRSNLVWVKISAEEFYTGVIVSRTAFMSTGDATVAIKKADRKLFEAYKSRLEVHYKSYDYGIPFKINLVDYVELHYNYEACDDGTKKGFSAFNFGLIFVQKIFHGDYVMNVDVPTFTQAISEETIHTIIGWDSQVFDGVCSLDPDILKVKVKILGDRVCKKKYSNAGYSLQSFDGYLCVQIVDGNRLTERDIGSPILDDKILIAIVAHVPDPDSELPALVIKRSKIEFGLNIPSDSILYYDSHLGAWKGTVDPADVEIECLEPEDFGPGTSDSKKEICELESNKLSDAADEYVSSSIKDVKTREPKNWSDFFILWACCCPHRKHGNKDS